MPEKQFVEDIASGKIERAIDVRTLVKCGLQKEFRDEYKKLKSTKKLASLLYNSEKVDSNSELNQIDYLAFVLWELNHKH